MATERAPRIERTPRNARRSVRIIPFRAPARRARAVVAAKNSFYTRHGKRALDVALGTVLLCLLSPVIVVVAIAVLLTNGWPVLYASERVGRGGGPFQMWKFRTMVRDADAVLQSWHETRSELVGELAANWKLRRDPRVTALGRFLRRSSLDELPQFINVLRGEMSIVGPRPYLPREAIGSELAGAICGVRPGITGAFQVMGRNAMDPRSRIQIEADYAADVSLVRDLTYMARTVVPLITLNGH